jgi:hypothetical protein
MYTDTSTIYRVSIPSSLICSFTASIGTSSLWKMLPKDEKIAFS